MKGSGLGVQGSGFRVQGSGFRLKVQGSRFRVQGSRNIERRINSIKNDRAKRYNKSAIRNPKLLLNADLAE
jgi:hypothetical protein